MTVVSPGLADTIKTRRVGSFAGAVRFWWVRHGPVPSTGGRLTGQKDVEVDLSDTETLAALAAALPQDGVVLVTPLKRTLETARALFGREPDGVEADLIEQDFGRWNDFRWSEIADEAASIGFWDNPVGIRPPGGESVLDHCARLTRFIEKAVQTWPGRDVVCVCHAGTVRAAVAHAMGIATAPAPILTLLVDPLSLTRTDALAEGGSTVSLVNRTFIA